ncbi:nucleotide-sugar transporter-domain-containing protein [Multifurca ochricompacta]|uniref:Nucleotide-sugar transporter-domain-containing protein n=1 Tax=Multifurca ochricompacta TaxID=376703 RepID=A0AAD4MA01_9AGAM|nr:nucleotide-sugar transporter-domain-containing protein [Multifurca ochricompacta]
MALSDSKILFWNGKIPLKTIHFDSVNDEDRIEQPAPTPPSVPSLCGVSLKYISLVTLAAQNAALSLLMHYSRVSMPPSRAYSAASAVLATELLKGLISLFIALIRVRPSSPQHAFALPLPLSARLANSPLNPRVFMERCKIVGKEVFRPDCWKLSIPAILYVIQNNLQFVAASNLEAATFQVSYQMKILTTAAFSVILLRRKLTPLKWLALFFLALGVGIVQIQCGVAKNPLGDGPSADVHTMVPSKGFLAVAAACFTSGLAGVYFEMVLKNSTADLWVRNVQLSLFSLLPALVPIIMTPSPSPGSASHSVPSLTHLFANFTPWAWATVLTQVLGGLITALVIKYADNIMKGFATSLSIVISFLASVALFHFRITTSFIVGATVVLTATWLYSQPDGKQRGSCTAPFKFLRARRSSNAPPPLSPMPTRPLPSPINPSITTSLGRRTPIGSPYSSPTTPAPPAAAAGLALASMRSHSMPSILLPATNTDPPV